jgi:N4-gp56 family major capsid protein
MPGQIWAVAAEGGYMFAEELSDTLRTSLQPLTKFRQFCDAKDATEKGLHRGDTFTWNRYSDVATQGRALDERSPMPETNFTVSQASLTITEAGNSVPYTGKLEMLAKHALVDIIDKTLKNDARKYFDIAAHAQFNLTPLRIVPTGGTSSSSVTLTENSTPAATNDIALGADHIKAISDLMQERNIPPYRGDDYGAISHPTTWRPVKNDLESVYQYTDAGIQRVFRGEIGRYEMIRFVEQNQIPKGGAADSTTFDPYTKTADPWNNGKSSWAFFFGGDTVAEAIVVPEEIRAKLPGDYGRSKGIAWYYLGGFGIVHGTTAPSEARILKWDSAA